MGVLPENVEKVRIMGKMRYYETQIKLGRHDVAEAYAKHHQIGPYTPVEGTPSATPIAPIEAGITAQPEWETMEAPENAPESDTHWNGWPKRTNATVFKRCINPRLVVIKLSDGRKSLLWNNGGRPWVLGAKIAVELSDRKGEPVYKCARGLPSSVFIDAEKIEPAAQPDEDAKETPPVVVKEVAPSGVLDLV
jgi:hypothetical protein